MASLVEIRGLVYEYPGSRALHDLSATIEKGTITALVGPNGAGKTTFLRCLAALEAPYSGTIKLDGLNIHSNPRLSHTQMGYLSDFFGLYDDLTVGQCLSHRAYAQELVANKAAEAIGWAAGAVNLTDRLGQKAGELSRGLRQRLAIGQAIIHKPKLLLLDEPASGLDPEARDDLATLLTQLRDGGMTILVSSHILAELEAYSSHMLIIDKGHIVDHTIVGDAALGSESAALTVQLMEPHKDFEKILLHVAEITRMTDTAAQISLKGGPKAQRDLLKKLIAAGAPVIFFGPDKVNLQDAYIERMREGRAS